MRQTVRCLTAIAGTTRTSSTYNRGQAAEPLVVRCGSLQHKHRELTQQLPAITQANHKPALQ